MKIAIVGTGGVGGYFGGKLAKAGNDVTFIARGEHLKAIRKDGLKVESIDGSFIVNPCEATDDIRGIGVVDLVIVSVKAWQVKEVAADLCCLVGNETLVLPLQNGIMATHELSEVLGEKSVISGLCRIISKIEAPGIIKHFGIKPGIVFGAPLDEQKERLHGIKEVFDEAEINNKISDDIEAELWKKFIAICVSGLLAVSHTTYGELRTCPETRKMMRELFEEIYELARLADVNINEDFIDRSISFIDSFPYETTSSLTRDVWEGKPSEIEYQNGTVVQLAAEYGLSVPVNQFVYNCILPQEKKARSK